MSLTTATADQEETGSKLSQLDQLKKFTVVVADTGDFQTIKEFKPRDATTNPSLIYAATQKEQYFHLLDEVLADRKNSGAFRRGADRGHHRSSPGEVWLRDSSDRAGPGFDWRRILRGSRSTRKLQSTRAASYEFKLYEEKGIDRQRILIKIASTWEGIKAAEVHGEGEGIELQPHPDVFAAAGGALCGRWH